MMTMLRGSVVAAFLVTAACRVPVASHAPGAAGGLRPAAPLATARGAALYVAYCAGCHGAAADGDGPFASMLGLRAADLRVPAIQSASERALVDRIGTGEPLEIPAGSALATEGFAVDAIAEYLPRLATADWEILRVGRLVYEGACAACHGPYGRGELGLVLWLGIPDLLATRDRHDDAALARISRVGIGTMPPLVGEFEAAELRTLIAYVRHLSDGFRLYDSYCAACHGDDGQGLYSQDAVPPATIAPPLRPPYERRQIVHMLRRERGVMPHLRDAMGEAQLHEVVAYLRTLAPSAAERPVAP